MRIKRIKRTAIGAHLLALFTVLGPLAILEGAPRIRPDVIQLRDGQRLEGRIVDSTERHIFFRVGGQLRRYPRSMLVSIKRAPRPSGLVKPPASKPVRRRSATVRARRRSGPGLWSLQMYGGRGSSTVEQEQRLQDTIFMQTEVLIGSSRPGLLWFLSEDTIKYRLEQKVAGFSLGRRVGRRLRLFGDLTAFAGRVNCVRNCGEVDAAVALVPEEGVTRTFSSPVGPFLTYILATQPRSFSFNTLQLGLAYHHFAGAILDPYVALAAGVASCPVDEQCEGAPYSLRLGLRRRMGRYYVFGEARMDRFSDRRADPTFRNFLFGLGLTF